MLTRASRGPAQFKIHTVTDDPRFAARDFFVRRRYRDFLWLRGQLQSAYPEAIVPPLPPPDKPYKGDDRFSAQFIQRRQAGLELFLRLNHLPARARLRDPQHIHTRGPGNGKGGCGPPSEKPCGRS